jgi:hypothetical protein
MAIHIGRREFIVALGSAAAWPLAARAQQGERMRRVGVLISAAATEVEFLGYLAAFVQELRRLGWSEGQNLQIHVRWNAGDAALSRTYAAQLIGLMPDVIVTSSTVNLATVQQATNTIPIVFVSVADAAAGRKCHRFQFVRIFTRRQMAQSTEGDCPRPQAGCSHVQSRHRSLFQVLRTGVRCCRAAARRASDKSAGLIRISNPHLRNLRANRTAG